MTYTEYKAIKSQGPVATEGAQGVFAGLAGKYFISRIKNGHPMIVQSGEYTLDKAVDEMSRRAKSPTLTQPTLTQICDGIIAKCTLLIGEGVPAAIAIERASEMIREERGIQRTDWPSTMICQRLFTHFGLHFSPLSDEEWSEITQQQIIE